MGFASLRHIKDRRSTFREPCRTRYVPPAGFGYPLGGLRPPSPCRPYFVPAAPWGFTPSELPPLARYPGHYCPDGPTCRFASRFARWLGQRAGPAGRGFWALTLASVPGGRSWFRAPTAGCSLGVRPFQGLQPNALIELPPDLLSRAFLAAPYDTADGASECRSASGSLNSPARQAAPCGPSSPLRVFAPVRSRHSNAPPFGLLRSPYAAAGIAAHCTAC